MNYKSIILKILCFFMIHLSSCLIAIFPYKSNANGMCLKVVVPKYNNLSTISNIDSLYTPPVDTSVLQKTITQKATTKGHYEFGIGYNISDYFEVELMLNQVGYSFERTEYINTKKEVYIPSTGGVQHNLFAAAATHRRNGRAQPFCNRNPDAFLTKGDICSGSVPHNLFAAAATHRRNGIAKPFCNVNPDAFLTKDDICGTPATVSQVFSSYTSGLAISSKIKAFIISIKLKPFGQQETLSPYFYIGSGIAFGKSESLKYTINSDGMIGESSPETIRTKALPLELGIGTSIIISHGFVLDISARYFDYGKHKLATNISKRIKGCKFSIGMIYTIP